MSAARGQGSPQAYSPSLEHLSSSLSSEHREAAYRASSFSVGSVGTLSTPPYAAGGLGYEPEAPYGTPTSTGYGLPVVAGVNGALNGMAMSGMGVDVGGVAGLKARTHTSLAAADAGDLTRCEVYDVHGAAVTVGSLAAAARTHCVLVFTPRDAVEVSGLVYAKVAHALHAAGTRLVFVTAWLPHQARKFLARFERVSPFPGTMVCDPDAVLFARFGLVRTRLGALAAAMRPSGRPRSRTMGRDISHTRTPSARLRSGAVVLRLPSALDVCEESISSLGLGGGVGAPGVVYHRAESAAAGVACHLDVLVACGADGAFVPDIDAAHLYRRFHNMRVTSQKARQADAKEAKVQRLRGDKLAGSRTRTSRQRTWHG